MDDRGPAIRRTHAAPEANAGIPDPARTARHAVHASPGEARESPRRRSSQIELVRQRIAHEYETFHAAVAEWARVKEQWLEEKARAVIQSWEHANFQERLREIERRLHLQRRRMRVLHAQLA